MTTKRVYITDLAAYNEGILSGRWVELPMEAEDLSETIESILNTGRKKAYQAGLCHCLEHEEYFITDYEGFSNSIDEYTDIFKLNEFLEEVACEDMEVVDLLLEDIDREDVLNILQEGNYRVFYDVDDGEDVVYQCLEDDGTLDNLPGWMSESYIDFAQIWVDWEIGSNWVYDWTKGIAIEIFY